MRKKIEGQAVRTCRTGPRGPPGLTNTADLKSWPSRGWQEPEATVSSWRQEHPCNSQPSDVCSAAHAPKRLRSG